MRSENDVLFPGSLENSDASEIKTKKWTVEYNLSWIRDIFSIDAVD